MLLLAHWFRAFAWTLLFEQVVAGLMLEKAVPGWGRRSSVIAVANLASHPAVWLIFPELGSGFGLSSATILLLSELWAFALEGWIYWLFLGSSSSKPALKTSLAANAVSLGAGLGLRHFGWV
jgi:hypothetical protein